MTSASLGIHRLIHPVIRGTGVPRRAPLHLDRVLVLAALQAFLVEQLELQVRDADDDVDGEVGAQVARAELVPVAVLNLHLALDELRFDAADLVRAAPLEAGGQLLVREVGHDDLRFPVLGLRGGAEAHVVGFADAVAFDGIASGVGGNTVSGGRRCVGEGERAGSTDCLISQSIWPIANFWLVKGSVLTSSPG